MYWYGVYAFYSLLLSPKRVSVFSLITTTGPNASTSSLSGVSPPAVCLFQGKGCSDKSVSNWTNSSIQTQTTHHNTHFPQPYTNRYFRDHKLRSPFQKLLFHYQNPFSIQHARDGKSLLIWSTTILVVSLITVKGMNTINICVG